MAMYDLCCFSYLASSTLMSVPVYPIIGSGTGITSHIKTLSADGPITAIVAARLGLKVALVTNNMGTDSDGIETLIQLQTAGVMTTSRSLDDVKSAQTLVFCDPQNTRTWFSYLPDTIEQLLKVDLSPFIHTKLAYIDYYPIIQAASNRAIEFCTLHKVPMFVNFGGVVPNEENIYFFANRNIKFLQTNIENFNSMQQVEKQIDFLWDKIKPEVVIITLGEYGCLARNVTEQIYIPAYKIKVLYTNGAGASFSGAVAYGSMHDLSLNDILLLGSAAGATNCVASNGYLNVSLSELNSMIKENPRFS